MKIAIVGAGITGLVAGFKLGEKGHSITLFEKELSPGGLSRGFKEESWDWSAECFFHHLFTSDTAAKKLLDELGLLPKLVFSHPKTSIFYKERVFPFDSPLSILKFPYLSLLEKIRTGLVTVYLKTVINWRPFEKTTASDWLKKYYGPKTYRIIWEPLLRGKFGHTASKISMVWFWARIKKRSLKLGYLEGSFEKLLEKLVKKIEEKGGKIFFGTEIKSLESLKKDFDKIILTSPVENLLPTNLPKMLGAVNIILSLKRKFLTDGTYWLSIHDKNFPFLIVVEHTNFVDAKRLGGNHLLYVGGYYPQNHRYFKLKKDIILKEFLPFLHRINPDFDESFLVKSYLSRNMNAQPIIPTNYSKIIPSSNPVPKVYLANMQRIYPWDRGINYAIREGVDIAKEVNESIS